MKKRTILVLNSLLLIASTSVYCQDEESSDMLSLTPATTSRRTGYRLPPKWTSESSSVNPDTINVRPYNIGPSGAISNTDNSNFIDLREPDSALQNAVQEMNTARSKLITRLHDIAQSNAPNATTAIQNAKDEFKKSKGRFEDIYTSLKNKHKREIENAKQAYENAIKNLQTAREGWFNKSKIVEGMTEGAYQSGLKPLESRYNQALSTVKSSESRYLKMLDTAKNRASVLRKMKQAMMNRIKEHLQTFQQSYPNPTPAQVAVLNEIKSLSKVAAGHLVKIGIHLKDIITKKAEALKAMAQEAREQMKLSKQHLVVLQENHNAATDVKNYAINKAEQLNNELLQLEMEQQEALDLVNQEEKSEESTIS